MLQALKGISLTADQGQTLGIIGRNGSGKSTFLQLLAGTPRPDSGRIAEHGKVEALLELEASIDKPVKAYSLGTPLGFTVAVDADPDIGLVNEVLAVGDQAFQQKCYDKMAEFQQEGRVFLMMFITGSMPLPWVLPDCMWTRASLQVEPAERYTVWERFYEKSLDHGNYWAGRLIFS